MNQNTYYLIITLIILIIYLFINYKTDTLYNYFNDYNIFKSSPIHKESFSTTYDPPQIKQNFIRHSDANTNMNNTNDDISKYLITDLDDDILISNDNLLINSDDYQITETTKHALMNALNNI